MFDPPLPPLRRHSLWTAPCWVGEEIDVIKLLDTESKNLQCWSERCQKRHLTIKHSMKKKGKHRVILISCSILLYAFDLDFGALL